MTECGGCFNKEAQCCALKDEIPEQGDAQRALRDDNVKIGRDPRVKHEDDRFKKSRKMTLFLFLRFVGGDELAADFHKLCRALFFELGVVRAGQFLQIFL